MVGVQSPGSYQCIKIPITVQHFTITLHQFWRSTWILVVLLSIFGHDMYAILPWIIEKKNILKCELQIINTPQYIYFRRLYLEVCDNLQCFRNFCPIMSSPLLTSRKSWNTIYFSMTTNCICANSSIHWIFLHRRKMTNTDDNIILDELEKAKQEIILEVRGMAAPAAPVVPVDPIVPAAN